MVAFFEDAERLFGTKSLYEILQLPTSASARQKCTEKEVKKAYFKLAGTVHPDKGNEAEKAQRTEKFQILYRAYAILSDSKQRKIYDETGEIDEDACSEKCDWIAVFRAMIKRFQEEAIEELLREYRESGEEREDLKEAYEKNEGDMKKILNEVLGATSEDEERLRDIIKEMIEKGELEEKPLFVHEQETKKKEHMKSAQKETTLELRAVVKYLVKENVSSKNIYERLKNIYGEDVPHYATVKRWAAAFRRGRESLENAPKSGRPISATSEKNIAAVKKIITKDRRMSVAKIAAKLKISSGTVHSILQGKLHLSKVSDRWVPRKNS